MSCVELALGASWKARPEPPRPALQAAAGLAGKSAIFIAVVFKLLLALVEK